MIDILRDVIINKTRKPHRCFGCLRTIQPPARMNFVAVAEDGTVHNDYFCDTCTMIRYDRNITLPDTISEGQLRDAALYIEEGAARLLDEEKKKLGLII